MVENELDLWILGIIKRDWEKSARLAEQTACQRCAATSRGELTGLGIDEASIEIVLSHMHLKAEKPLEWSEGDLAKLVHELRLRSKPSLIAANKADLPGAEGRLEGLKAGGSRLVIPCAAEAELLLRRASEHGVIKYTPGDGSFEVTKQDLTSQQLRALELVRERVLDV